MKTQWNHGILLGGIASIASIVGNELRADPHSLSAFPDILTLVIFSAGLYVSLLLAKKDLDSSSDPGFTFLRRGSHVTLIASIEFAVLLGGYALVRQFSMWLYVIGLTFAAATVIGVAMTVGMRFVDKKTFQRPLSTA